MGPVRWIGAVTLGFLGGLIAVVSLLYGALKAPLLTRTRGLAVVYNVTVAQLRFTGAQGLPLVSLAALALGVLIIAEANEYLPAEYACSVAAHIITKDVMPLAVAIIIVGRSGSAICVELAGMKLSGEIDALRSMGLALEHFIVLPRLIAGVGSSLVLSVYGLVIAMAGGHLVTRSIGVPLPFTVEALFFATDYADVVEAMLKACVFGGGIVLVAIREGYSVRVSAREIPQATTRAMVRGMGLCLVLNSVISVLAS